MENKKEIDKEFYKRISHIDCDLDFWWDTISEALDKALEKQKSDLVKEIEKLEVIDTANSALNSPNDYMEKGAYMFKNQILEVLNKAKLFTSK